MQSFEELELLIEGLLRPFGLVVIIKFVAAWTFVTWWCVHALVATVDRHFSGVNLLIDLNSQVNIGGFTALRGAPRWIDIGLAVSA